MAAVMLVLALRGEADMEEVMLVLDLSLVSFLHACPQIRSLILFATLNTYADYPSSICDQCAINIV